VVVADTGNYIIRVIPRLAHTAFGQAMAPLSIYTVAGNTNYGYSGNGGPAVDAELGLDSFNGVAVDPRGDIVFADVDNNVVRLVAASNGSAFGHSVTADDIYTIAGTSKAGFKGSKTPATKAWLNTPQGVAIDSAGNLFISDSANNRIRMVAGAKGTYEGLAVKAGDIYTVAGSGGTGDTGTGGLATAAELNGPTGVSVGPTGNVVVADNGNNVIREISGTPVGPPTVTTIKPKSGPITGDRKVTILGSNLSSTTAVMFGARPALSFTVKSAKKIVAYSPTATLGTIVIRVYSPTGESVANAVDSYTYEAATAAKKHARKH
jgi:hypothetical protein